MAKGGIADIAMGRSDLYRIDPRTLVVKDGWNCRDVDFDPKNSDDLALALSIAANGVKEPLTVTWQEGHAFVTNGHRRRAAALYAIEHLGALISTVPVRTEDRYTNEADHVFSMIVRNSGKPLSPIEQGRVFKRLVELGWNESDIVAKSGMSAVWVRQLLDLQAAPTAVTDLVKEGKVSATLAAERLKKSKGDGEALVKELTEAVEKAKSEGKERATAKHLRERLAQDDGTPRNRAKKEKAKAEPSKGETGLRQTIAKLYEALELGEAIEDDGKGGYLVAMTADQYATFRTLAGA